MAERFCTTLDCVDTGFLPDGTLDGLPLPLRDLGITTSSAAAETTFCRSRIGKRLGPRGVVLEPSGFLLAARDGEARVVEDDPSQREQ